MAAPVTATNRRTGGELLADCLLVQGVDLAFGVPGESYLALLDALHDRPALRFINARQEGGAAMMADAYAKLTGRPGVAMVTRGPGATNAASGLHVAFQDSSPVLLLVGQIARDTREREAFQELDYRRVFGQMAKWVAEVDSADRLPEFVSRAFHTMRAGRPGPVVLALPEDMLVEATAAEPVPAAVPVVAHPGADQIAALGTLLSEAQRPFLLVGGGGWDSMTAAALGRFASVWRLPLGTSFRCQDFVDNDNRCYVGPVGIGMGAELAAWIRESDLILCIGARLGEITTVGYTLVEPPRPRQRLVHVHPDPEELGRVYRPDLAIPAAPAAFAAAALRLRVEGEPVWSDHTRRLRAAYQAHQKPRPMPGEVQLGEVIAWLSDRLPADAILCNGAGNYATWLHRHYRYRTYRSQLAPTSGSMGYGVPAAVAAKLAAPDRTVIAFAGDGCFQMTQQEFGTAMQYGAPIIVVVVDNGSYGTIRMHQEREYPDRVIGTALGNPDFALLARAYGGFGATVETTDAFAPAFEAALSSGRPAILHVRIPVEALTPAAALTDIQTQGRARRQSATSG